MNRTALRLALLFSAARLTAACAPAEDLPDGSSLMVPTDAAQPVSDGGTGDAGSPRDASADSGDGGDLNDPLTWWGLMEFGPEATPSVYYYVVHMEPDGTGRYRGNSYLRSVERPEYFAVFDTTGSLEGGDLVYEEGVLIDSAPEPGTPWCPGAGRLPAGEHSASGVWTPLASCSGVFGSNGRNGMNRVPREAWRTSLPDCPCTYSSSVLGPAGKGTWADAGKDKGFHPGADKEIRWTPSAGGPGQQCTFNEAGELINGGLAAGTPDKVSPQGLLSVPLHFWRDVCPLGSLTCQQYLDIFPPNQGRDATGKPCKKVVVTPAPTFDDDADNKESCMATLRKTGEPKSALFGALDLASALLAFGCGDPHMRSFDGLGFDMQAVGEFIALRSLDDDMEIQLRTAPYQRLLHASIIVGVAVTIDGDRMSLQRDGDRWALRVNGSLVTETGVVSLPGGGSLERTAGSVALVWADGSALEVRQNGTHLNIYPRIHNSRGGRFEGLLGDGNGDPNDDLRTQQGYLLEPRTTFRTFYDVFVNSWRIRDAESLFDYPAGTSTESFSDLGFPYVPASSVTLTDAQRAAAEELCRSLGLVPGTFAMNACIFDVAHTGDASFAFSDAQLGAASIVTDLLEDSELEGTFEFTTGRPVHGTTETRCGTMTVTTTNTERFAEGFRNQTTGEPAEVVFEFDQPIQAFRLELGRVRGDEFLSTFNIPPSRVSGTLTRQDDRVSTFLALPSDFGAGTVFWEDLDTTLINLEMGGPVSTALAIERFEVDCAAAQP